jgi:RecB family exonuclease
LTVLGTVWHHAVDVYENYDHDLVLALKTFNYYWDHPDELDAPIDFWHRRTTKDGLRKRGQAMLQRYDELRPWAEGRLIGTEIHFEVPLGEHTIRGYIDKLWMRPGQHAIEVIDFKTGSYVPEKLKFNVQFTAYCYATERVEFWENVPGFEDGYDRFYGWKRGGQWFHARNTKMFNAGWRTDQDYKRLLLQANEMERSIEEEIYPLDYSGETCGWCVHVERCGLEVADPRTLNVA